MVNCALLWFDIIRYGLAWLGMTWGDTVRYGAMLLILFGTEWIEQYAMVKLGMLW